MVASNEHWTGEIYQTRSGRQREAFNGPAELLDALSRLTGWELAQPEVPTDPDPVHRKEAQS